MILKVACVQPVLNNYKYNTQKPKNGLKRKKTASFASILENTIKSQSNKGYAMVNCTCKRGISVNIGIQLW
ncbi:hypothetical protein Ga0466249_004339 [Sporomusaceae bacterium BoRhaA]|uniref:hypothetical protein n=1 Tax=Pelorhabdus rhamnosifermentans TaxID=2772457 RepID=UPI001C063B6C|nr:hypothetical protein [Pelorhabdus rhamnosifermentans]MBU2703203.1 hypothetical protein [Pelorhabdus rhamnosifermentans]